jgi:hypothetical protein
LLPEGTAVTQNAGETPAPQRHKKGKALGQTHERLLHTAQIKVTNTSLDHLLLGTAADVAIIRL